MLKYPFMREFVVTSPFGPRIHPVTGQPGSHRGTDYATPVGTPVYSPLAGVVKFMGEDDINGKYIGVANSDFTVSFAHMDTTIGTPGDPVAAGQVIGLTGNTGRSTGPHVHITVRNAAGVRIDPETVIIPESKRDTGTAAPALALALLAVLT